MHFDKPRGLTGTMTLRPLILRGSPGSPAALHGLAHVSSGNAADHAQSETGDCAPPHAVAVRHCMHEQSTSRSSCIRDPIFEIQDGFECLSCTHLVGLPRVLGLGRALS